MQCCHMNHLFHEDTQDAKVMGAVVRKEFVLQDSELSKGESVTAAEEMERSRRKSFFFS